MQNNMYTNRFTFALFCKNHHVYSKIYNLVFCVFGEYLCNFVCQFKNRYPRLFLLWPLCSCLAKCFDDLFGGAVVVRR